jgi:hypothetical protein
MILISRFFRMISESRLNDFDLPKIICDQSFNENTSVKRIRNVDDFDLLMIAVTFYVDFLKVVEFWEQLFCMVWSCDTVGNVGIWAQNHTFYACVMGPSCTRGGFVSKNCCLCQ